MITSKSVKQLSDLLNKKEISAVEIANAYIDRINKHNKTINAYITVNPEKLLINASESDKRRANGNELSEFDGIPIAIKDNICTKGLKTSCASKILGDFVPPYNATVIEKLEQKGLLVLGKLNMDEFAMGSTNETSCYGPVKNPHNIEHVPGGSSGGSAAAVAAHMAPAALGSDTGGSIRQPASFCGVTGMKPTYGRVSRYGLVAFASSLDQIGPLARNIDDAALLTSIISGKDTRDSTSVDPGNEISETIVARDIKTVRIGVPEEYFEGVSDETKHALSKKINELDSTGAQIVPISLKMTEYAVPAYYLIATAEASSNLARYDGVKYGRRSENASTLDELYKLSRSEGFGAEVKRRIILGTYSLSSGYYDAYYLKALKTRTCIINDFKRAFDKVDIIAAPVVPTTAFRLGENVSNPLEMYLSDILTISANLAAIPSISIPIAKDSKGLPIGMQLMGTHFDEKTVFEVGKAIEKDITPLTVNLD
ncbi:MAG: Asp-tRNA(Asn)/Glu-tRNA(Gln) amidotransferase subunit GatA [Spirochaetes bacterium]|nr:Asp-tRNA(Asn)/Glu-tRNA(Gln) amidotransferase subunit GatA [Spirochaetota bacterium]MBN2771648.1 Asp-tRNA(Asn)/Glu-tRNA(Gln) amidotransferase subunit GatA [Spirochaetota bacterium]